LSEEKVVIPKDLQQKSLRTGKFMLLRLNNTTF